MAEGLKLVVGDDGIATVYMDNGENRYRMSFVDAWNNILDEIERNTAIKGLIITGTGKYFSLGLDLQYLQKQTPDHVMETRRLINTLHKRLLLLPIPTVAALNGHAYGAGAFLTLSCDYRVMRSDRGYLCWPEVALGMRIQSNNFEILRLKIPKGKPYREAILFGKAMSGTEARSFQIVDIVCEKDILEVEARSLIKEALGKRGLSRKALGDMKKDVYDFPEHFDADASVAMPKL